MCSVAVFGEENELKCANKPPDKPTSLPQPNFSNTIDPHPHPHPHPTRKKVAPTNMGRPGFLLAPTAKTSIIGWGFKLSL